MSFLRKYNTLLVTGTTAIQIPIPKRGVVDFAVSGDWTPAAGDVKILVDNTAAANVTNLPTAKAGANTGAIWEFVLTAAELSCKQAIIIISDAATKAIEDQCFIVETFGNASAMYAADFSLANLPANVTQLLGTAWLAPGTAGTPDVNAKLLGGTAQTGRDLGLSVLISSGSGSGQLDVTSGVIKSNLAQILGTALTETAGLLAGGFKKFFNVVAPTMTALGVDQTGDSYARIGANGASLTAVPESGDFTSAQKTSLNAATPAVTVSDKTGFSLSTAGILAIWHQLTSAVVTAATMGKLILDNLDATISSRTKPADTQAAVTLVTTTTNLTNAPPDSSGVTTLLSRLSAARAGYLDLLNTYLDAAISSRSTYAGADTSGTTTLLSRLNSARAGYLDLLNTYLDAAVSSRSTYAGADTSGTTTLLARLTALRAGYIDLLNTYLDAAISSRLATSGYTVSPTVAQIWQRLLSLDSGVSGSAAAALNAVGIAADPWTTVLPGNYAEGTAGEILGTTAAAEDPALADSALDAITALLNSGFLNIYSGAKPATAGGALSGNTLLAVLRFGDPAFNASSGGTAVANAITPDTDINATGTATWARLLKPNNTTTVCDLTVGTSGADINLTSVSLTIHGVLSVSSLSLTLPSST